MKEKLNTIVFKEPYKDPVVMQIENSLEAEQKEVKGNIQVLNVEDDICIICNEEAFLKDEKPNIIHGKYGTIFGNIFVIGANIETGEFVSLAEEQAEKYIKELKEMAIKNEINIYTSYVEMINKHQGEFDNFPIEFAFDDEQFKIGMQSIGLTEKDENEVIGVGAGGFIRKKDIQAYINMQSRFLEEERQGIENDTTGEKFIKEMFLEKMINYRYAYTKDIKPVLKELDLTMNKINKCSNLKNGFKLAKQECLESYFKEESEEFE